MPMKNPPHPGKVVRVSCLEPLDLSVTAGAKVLGVSRQALSNLVNGRAGMSAEMAIRLAKAFGSTTDSSAAEDLLGMHLGAFDQPRRRNSSQSERSEEPFRRHRRRLLRRCLLEGQCGLAKDEKGETGDEVFSE